MPKEKEEKPPVVEEDPDKDFWEKEGITDDDEKEAIRSRARVLRYHDYQLSKAQADDKKKKGKKWFDKD